MKQNDVKAKGKASWSVEPKIEEAYIKGEDWTVSILGAQDSQDFAASAIDKTYDAANDAFGGTTVALDASAAPGIRAEYKGWTVSGGFVKGEYTVKKAGADKYYFYGYYKDADGNATARPDWTVEREEAPENFVVLDKVKAESGTAAVKTAIVNYSATVATPDFVFDDVTVGFGAAVGSAYKSANLGLSAKVAYANDQLSASVASDVVLEGVGKDEIAFDADVAAKFSFAPVTVDAYFATNASTANKLLTPKSNVGTKNLLSAKVAADLASFDVPVKVAVYAKDVINAQVFGVSASATVDALSVNASFDYGVKEEAYLVGATVSYNFDAFKVAAGINYNSTKQLYANASIETTTLIPGATLKLAYGPVSKDGKVTTNLLDEKYGKIDATCTIAF
ncbi:MAG: hypothetical protein MSS69_06735 [Spirochaetales bacterium]|nr:hypothetical protein [Spirochaetales bacterium]